MSAPSFQFSPDPIEPAGLADGLVSPAAGAVVTFTGRVRDHSRGRAVARLEYEGAEELARALFAELEGEARAAYAVDEIRCVHRTGVLAVGEIAVWIGVSAAHRGAAFDACRFLIDELKHRLPLWKKEHYADGGSAWIEEDTSAR